MAGWHYIIDDNKTSNLRRLNIGKFGVRLRKHFFFF